MYCLECFTLGKDDILSKLELSQAVINFLKVSRVLLKKLHSNSKLHLAGKFSVEKLPGKRTFVVL